MGGCRRVLHHVFGSSVDDDLLLTRLLHVHGQRVRRDLARAPVWASGSSGSWDGGTVSGDVGRGARELLRSELTRAIARRCNAGVGSE